MNTNYKPEGYNSVSPYFIVSGAEKMVDLLKNVFNATEKRRYNHADGSIMHMEVQIEDSIIMLSEASAQFPANTFMMHVYVPDADAVYQKAVQLGCRGVEAPVQKNGEIDKRGTFIDFAGNMWSVAHQEH